MRPEQSFIEIVDHSITSKDARLPVFSPTAMRIQQEVAKEEPDVRFIEKLIVSDQSLTAEVLRVSNSSFFKGLVPVSTVRSAIMRLGINEISNIVMLVTHENNFRSKDPFFHDIMRKLWRHSVGCAMAAHWLAKHCGFQAIAHESFFAGLLHDVGKLFILTVIDDISHAEDIDFKPSTSLVTEAMSQLHTGHGYSLMKHWNLPERYCEIVRDHHKDDLDTNDFLNIMVRLADKACNKIGLGPAENSDVILSATMEADFLHITDVETAKLEIMLEDSLASKN
jgi:HD-like signal output (HDOD) protein